MCPHIAGRHTTLESLFHNQPNCLLGLTERNEFGIGHPSHQRGIFHRQPLGNLDRMMRHPGQQTAINRFFKGAADRLVAHDFAVGSRRVTRPGMISTGSVTSSQPLRV